MSTDMLEATDVALAQRDGGAAVEATKSFRTRLGTLPQIVVCLSLLALIGLPVCNILYGAFRSDTPLAPVTTFSLDAINKTYGELFRGEAFAHVFFDTIVLGLLVMVLCMALGGILSFIIARTDVPGRGLMRLLLLTPLFYSPLLDIIGWEFLLAERSGAVNQLWRHLTGSSDALLSIYSYGGVVLVMVLHVLPYVILLLIGPLQSLDSATEESAEVFGATRLQTAYYVTWPLMRPAVAACSLFVFILAIEIFTIPTILGSRIRLETLAQWVYEWAHGSVPDLPAAAAAGSVLMIVAGVVLYFYRRLTIAGEQRYVTVGGRGFKTRTLGLGRWRWPVGIAATTLVLIFTVLPFVAVLARSLMQTRVSSFSWGMFTPGQYALLLQNHALPDFIFNSLALGIVGAVACVALGGTVGLWKARSDSLPVSISDYLMTLAFGLPGVLVGIGLLWTFVSTPIYMTFWILLVAVVARFSGLAIQGTNAAVLQMDRNLEEAAETFGASKLFATLRVTLPILKGTLVSLWLMLFLILMRELSMTVILYGPPTRTLTIQSWNYTTDGDLGLAAALSMIQFAITLGVFAVWRLLTRGGITSAAATGVR